MGIYCGDFDRSSSLHACLFNLPGIPGLASREGKMIHWCKTAPQGSRDCGERRSRGFSFLCVTTVCGQRQPWDSGELGVCFLKKDPALKLSKICIDWRVNSKDLSTKKGRRMWRLCDAVLYSQCKWPPWQARPAQEADWGAGGRASAVPLLLCLLSGPQTVVPETAALASPGIWLEIQITRPTHAYCIRNSGGGAQQSVLTSCPGDCGVHHSWTLTVYIR